MTEPYAPLAHTIMGVCKASNTGKSKIYEEIGAGRLKAHKIGRKTIILDSDLQAWLTNLPEIQPKADGPEADICQARPSPTPNKGHPPRRSPAEPPEGDAARDLVAAREEAKAEYTM